MFPCGSEGGVEVAVGGEGAGCGYHAVRNNIVRGGLIITRGGEGEGRDLLGCSEMADTGFEEIVFDGPFHEVVADG